MSKRVKTIIEIFAEMGYDDRPFSQDGLSCGEILTLYRDGADKEHMITVLSELSATDRGSMRKFLTARGVEIPKKVAKPQGGPSLEERLGDRLEGTIEYLRRRAACGASLSEVSKEMEESRYGILALCKKHGIKFRSRVYIEKARYEGQIEKGRALAKSGKTAKEAAEQLGVTPSTARKYARAGGYKFVRPYVREGE